MLVYADADSDVPLEWGDSDAKDIKDGEKVQLRGFSTANHKVDTLVSYRYLLPELGIHNVTNQGQAGGVNGKGTPRHMGNESDCSGTIYDYDRSHLPGC